MSNYDYKSLQKVDLPDGKYIGWVHGNVGIIKHNKSTTKIEISDGIRGSVGTDIVVRNGDAYFYDNYDLPRPWGINEEPEQGFLDWIAYAIVFIIVFRATIYIWQYLK